MNYTDFKESVLAALKTGLGPAARLSVSDIIKNNDTHLDGLTILTPEHNLSPTVYLNHYYRQYRDGRALSDIVEDILAIFQEHRMNGPVDVSFFTDYERVKPRIAYKLVNYARNRELLTQVPHRRFLDLAIVFYYLLESGSSGTATILIRNQHLSYWNISADELYPLALANTPKLLSCELRSMADILTELFPQEASAMLKEAAGSGWTMYVLTNQHRLNGAIGILYPHLLKDFANRIGSDLYILPSSIHEVLLIPASGSISGSELSAMVQEVNDSHLSPEEVLSDHVYFFSRKDGRVTQ